MSSSYHHGDLRSAVLRAAADVVARDGADQLSLRTIAAELNVSHTAFRHHFGGREGVFTALATEGFTGLAAAIDAASDQGFAEVGAAYVLFAVEHPGQFAVMFRPSLVDPTDPGLAAAIAQTRHQLTAGAAATTGGSDAELALAATAAWSLVHGLATLVLSGALDVDQITRAAGGDLRTATVRMARLLFSAPTTDPEGTPR